MNVKIGLELHICLKTQSKLFSFAPNNFQATPNSMTTSYDWAYPGTLPTINKLAVRLAIRAAGVFNATVAHTLNFDRKNYYYFDLPKGYQITQFLNPIGKNGQTVIHSPSNGTKTIKIQFIALEEDSAKTLYASPEIWLDFNRVGVPLIEVTTGPNFSNAEEVKNFLNLVFDRLRKSNVSLCQFEWGTVRVDVNISVSDPQRGEHPRTEVKNLNSLNNIEKAINQEIALQNQLLRSNQPLPKRSWTKNFDEQSQSLETVRAKFSTVDYFYIPEANLLPFPLPQKLVQKEFDYGKNIVLQQEEILAKYQLTFADYQIFFRNEKVGEIFIFLHNSRIIPKHILLFLRELIIKKPELSKINSQHYPEFVRLLRAFSIAKINFRQVKELFQKILRDEKIDLTNWLKQQQIQKNLVSEAQLKQHLKNLLQNDSQIILRYQNRPEATTKYLMGKLMAKTKGQAAPELCQKLITELLKK